MESEAWGKSNWTVSTAEVRIITLVPVIADDLEVFDALIQKDGGRIRLMR